MSAPPEVVVTGVGCVTPLGPDREAFWSGLLAGHRGIRGLGSDDLHGLPAGSGDVPWVGGPARVASADGAYADPMPPLILAAAAEAIADAGLDLAAIDRTRVGCVVGTSKGGLVGFARGYEAFRRGEMPDPRAWNDFPPHAASSVVAGRFGIRGPTLSPVAACATGLVCVLRAAQLIRDGVCDVAVAGSGDASLHPAVLGSFRRMGVLATRFAEPAAACRPFNTDRDGFAVGEGTGLFVLERGDHATARGRRPRAVFRSGVLFSDPIGLTSIDPCGEVLSHAVATALRTGGLSPADVAHLNLHGTGTRANDAAEASGLAAALGPRVATVPAVAVKGAIGHLLGASGAVELVATVLALESQTTPPTANLTEPDPACPVGVAAEPQPLGVGAALKVSLGFGGHVAVACLAPV